jgi:hypothetical protein
MAELDRDRDDRELWIAGCTRAGVVPASCCALVTLSSRVTRRNRCYSDRGVTISRASFDHLLISVAGVWEKPMQ